MLNRDLAAQRLLAVTEEELQHIVLDIHDGPVQDLFAALSQLMVLRTQMNAFPQLPAESATALHRAIGLLEGSLSSIRNLLGTFRTPEFVNHGLVEIVEDIVVQYESFTGTSILLEMVGPLPEVVSLSVKIALCRILQEALSNVRRHAEIETASVRLWAEENFVFLEITDQGRGFEPPPLTGPQATERYEHIGLRGMRERAALVGGKLSLYSRPGAGTRVRVEIPAYE